MSDDIYFWVKALHIIAVVSWMAGMLYLPRLFVYHSQVAVGSDASELFKIMERKLLRFIINPAMIVTWLAGGYLIHKTHALDVASNGYWMYGKLALLILMQACHAVMARCRRQFANDKNIHSAKFYRILNEVPAVLMVGIIILVVVRPV